MGRSLSRLVGVLLVLAAVLAPGATTADAAPLDRFSLSARADGMGIEVTATGFPLVPEGKAAFVTPATAQSLLQSLGSFADSRSFASSPYPGEFVVSLQTTVNGLGAGILPAIPSYPFYVQADAASGSQSEVVGPYMIRADASQTSASADARIGIQTGVPSIAAVTARSNVSVDPDSGELVSEATATVEPMKLNDLLSIGEVRSSARLTYDPSDPDATVRKETSFSVATVSIAGVQLGFTDEGLQVAGQTLLPVDVSGLEALLRPAGISIDYVPAVETDTSITSAALAITFEGDFPQPIGAVRLRYVLGQVSASSSTPTLVPTTSPPAAIPPVPSASGAVDLGAAAPAPPSPPALPRRRGPVAPASSTRELPLTDPSVLYLALAGAAVVSVGTSRFGVLVDRVRGRRAG